MRSSDLSRRVTLLLGRREEVRRAHDEATRELQRLVLLRKDLERAQIVIQEVAQLTQDQLQYRISELSTCALAAVFPRPYVMCVRFECKRGRTECSLAFRLPNGEEVEPMESTGYGPVDVASFSLRLTCLAIERPARRPVVWLDEPFKFVSKDLLPRVSEMLHELSEKLGIQFIIITHEDRLIAEGDTVFRVRLVDGVSVVTNGSTPPSQPSAPPSRAQTPPVEEMLW